MVFIIGDASKISLFRFFQQNHNDNQVYVPP